MAISLLLNSVVELLALYWLFNMLIRDMVELPDVSPGVAQRRWYETGLLLLAAFWLMNARFILWYEDWLVTHLARDMLTLSQYTGALMMGLFLKWVYAVGMLVKRRSITPDRYVLMVECVLLPLILITGWRLWTFFL